jgi:hypothetical protein
MTGSGDLHVARREIMPEPRLVPFSRQVTYQFPDDSIKLSP